MGRGKIKVKERTERRLLKESLGLDTDSIASVETELTSTSTGTDANYQSDTGGVGNGSIPEAENIHDALLEAILVLEEKHTKSSSSARISSLKKIDTLFSCGVLCREMENEKVESLYERLLDALYICLNRKASSCGTKECTYLCNVVEVVAVTVDQEDYEDDLERMLMLFQKKLCLDVEANRFNSNVSTAGNKIKSDKVLVAMLQTYATLAFLLADEDRRTLMQMKSLERYFPAVVSGDECQCEVLNDHSEAVREVFPFSVQAVALNAWGLLASVLSCDFELLSGILQYHLPRFLGYLLSDNVAVRTEAGENIAFLLSKCPTKISEKDESKLIINFVDMSADAKVVGSLIKEYKECVGMLECLAKDGNKSKAKRERKVQRASFRVFYRSVADCVQPEEKIKLKDSDPIILLGWAYQKYLALFRRILKGGFSAHFFSNGFLEAVFDTHHKIRSVRQGDGDHENKLNRKQIFEVRDKTQTLLRKKQREAKRM